MARDQWPKQEGRCISFAPYKVQEDGDLTLVVNAIGVVEVARAVPLRACGGLCAIDREGLDQPPARRVQLPARDKSRAHRESEVRLAGGVWLLGTHVLRPVGPVR